MKLSWDDEEERRYREWLREERQRAAASQPAVDWKEYEAEEAHRSTKVQSSPLTVTPSGHGKSVTVTRLSL